METLIITMAYQEKPQMNRFSKAVLFKRRFNRLLFIKNHLSPSDHQQTIKHQLHQSTTASVNRMMTNAQKERVEHRARLNCLAKTYKNCNGSFDNFKYFVSVLKVPELLASEEWYISPFFGQWGLNFMNLGWVICKVPDRSFKRLLKEILLKKDTKVVQGPKVQDS